MGQKLSLVAVLGLAALCPALRGQSVNEVRVFATEPGARFWVDNQVYTGSAVFLWPQGSKHFITAEPEDVGQWGTKYEYNGWENNLRDADKTGTTPITADAGLKWIQLNFTLSYLVVLSVLPDCSDIGHCAVPGQVESPCGVIVNRTARCYVPRGTVAKFAAYPGPGAIFVEWMLAQNISPQLPTTYIINIPINGPTPITARFTPAVGAKTTVTLQTDPQELSVIVDSSRVKPPVSFEWGWNTVHHVAVEPNQNSRGVAYVFHSWSDGGEASHDVKVPSPSNAITLTAHFVPAHTVRFLTSPPNLKLTVDGRQDWINYGFGWMPGSVHRVVAPLIQTDAQGRRYRFASWSNGQPASFEYTAGQPTPPTGESQVVATYRLLGQATITTSPANLPVEVDGKACATPCAIERDAGESVRISAAAVLNSSERSRLMFRSWTDASSAKREIELSPEPKIYLAQYTSQSRLSMASLPPEGARIVADPPSPDGFYDDGSTVSLMATLGLGFRIQGWSGDLSGSALNTTLVVDAPKNVVLALDRAPAIGPSGIRNAATGANDGEFAPGSLISVFGANLAPGIAIGPSNPLAQTLQGVTARVDDTFLPLIFVSPEQINAQLPATTVLGSRRLIIRSEGYPETSMAITVVRNAPGLFSGGAADQPTGYFSHSNGSPVTAEQAARPGDIITVFGTGLGPYSSKPPDGFVLDESSGYVLVDKVQVIVGDAPIDPLFAGRSGAGAGVDAIRFRVPVSIPDSKTLPVRISVNGRGSNTVLLPVSR